MMRALHGLARDGIAVVERGEWLHLRRPLRGARGSVSHSRRLEWNHELEGATKLALANDGGIELRSEISLCDKAHVSERLARTRQGFARAAAHNAGNSSRPRASTAEPLEISRLEAMLDERGRVFRRRSESELGVVLPGVVERPVRLESTPRWTMRASLELGTLADWTPESRTALCRFLMMANGTLRLARASLEGERARFEVCYDTTPAPIDLDHAIVALEAASRFYYREARALREPGLASRFLDWLEGPSESSRTTTHTEHPTKEES